MCHVDMRQREYKRETWTETFAYYDAYLESICLLFYHVKMQEKKITVKICHQNFYSLFQRIEWHPNPTDFELCTMKGKSKVSLSFSYLNQFDHYTPNYTITQYIIIYYILKSLPCNSMNVSKELLPISNERIMRNGC